MNEVMLKIPLKSEFVLIARLAASGYCARLGIDLEKTEDIKVTISEILNICIIDAKDVDGSISIRFDTDNRFLNITFETNGIKSMMTSDGSNEMGRAIIKTLCDDYACTSEDTIALKFEIEENK